MEGRQYLGKKILLCGENDGEEFKRIFNIVKRVSDTVESVCYEAYYEKSERGVLAEFYPKDVYALERNDRGQLVHSKGFQATYERFVRAKQEYTESYEMLLDVKRNSDDQDLTTFIPAFEIYHGCDENGNIVGTVYIWTPESKLETFDKVCEEIHKHPGKNPEHKLVTVLNAIESLAKCIKALHMSDMIHGDIKPSNFGFIKHGGKTLTQMLSMSDISSVRSAYGKYGCDGMMGTEGYMEPEAGYEETDNQTDIYSIGATLFHAVIVTDETKAGSYLYRSDYYGRLRELVDDSRLIQASEANSHPKLRNILTVILQKCLCERMYRYENCDELLDDLETALYYALPSKVAKRNRLGEKWILADVEKSLDMNQEKNSSLAIQYHLYEKPLYQYIAKDENVINVLVIGFGNYGQKFLDSCLQTGQICGKTLNVTVISDDVTDKEIYLSERPELAEFFDIDGSLADSDDTYGKVTFEITELKRNDQKSNADILQNIMCEHYDTKPSHYVFIALGEDKLNLLAAKACKMAIEMFEMRCTVSYICESKRKSKQDDVDICPVYVNDDIKKSALYPEIERMAFNTHLIWEKNLNIDYRNTRADFKKKYNHDSSVSNVLSIKYKLYSVGIDLEQCNFDEAACLFEKLISDSENCYMKDELVWVEHRRWVTEKLCLGWRRIRNLEECLGGVTKDEKRKRHVCIVRSMPNQKLTKEYKTENYEKWDKASKSDLAQLDELDRMSVELHRVFADKAKLIRKQNLLSGNSVAAIKVLIENDRIAEAAFQEWFICLQDIMNGDAGKVHLYKGLKNSFLNAAKGLRDERKKAVREQVKAFESMFFPILASMEYRDWKQDDVAFIDNIPFVLTYSENVYMVIPYATGDNTKVFGNVAAPTVVNPARILYLYFAETGADISELEKSIPYIAEYMKKKHFKAVVELIITYTDGIAYAINEDFDKKVRKLSDGRIKQVKHIALENIENLPVSLTDYLRQRSSGKKIFAIEKNETGLSNMLRVVGFYNSFSNYRFDSNRMEFCSMTGSDLFTYIKKSPYITVTDMTAFRRSSSESNNQPEFFTDYMDLWHKYCETRNVWKSLCSILGNHAGKNDIIASFEKKPERDKNRDSCKHRYIIPFVCGQSASNIINFLKKQNIAEQGSKVNGYTSNSCEVIILDRCGYETEYDKLFSNVYALMIPEAIAIYQNTRSHTVHVTFDNLVVSGIKIPDGRRPEYISLMNYFKMKGYVINLITGADGKMSFTYATRQIKELLTTAGKILEVYTYHKVRELGSFDDVVSSFEIDWEGTEVKSEFDCIMTKGFRTLFVECKARSSIEQEFYYKIAELKDKFGINATAVLIVDTQEKNCSDNASVNAIQRKRGSMIDVVTIWKQDEIDNIGQTLLKVIDGTYVSKEE